MSESPHQPDAAPRDTPLIHRLAPKVKWVSIFVIVVAVFFMMAHLPIREALDAMKGWIDRLGVWGPLVYGIVYVVAVLLLAPGSVLTIGAGAIFGLWVGLVVTSLASTTAAALALLITRHFARRHIEKLAQRSPKFDAMDRAVSEGGWKIVGMLRLSPAVPFNLQNYFYGLTRIRFWPCVLTTWAAMLPGTLMFVFIGHLGFESLDAAAQADSGVSIGRWIALGLGLIATVAVTVYVTKLANKALKKQTEIDDAAGNDEADNDGEAQPSGWRWGTTLAVVLAIAAVIGAATAKQWGGKFAELF